MTVTPVGARGIPLKAPAQPRSCRCLPVMNAYDIHHVNGDIYEVEADFFEREGDDWVFYAVRDEVFRVSWFDVLGVSKSSIRPTQVTQPVDELWL